MDTGAPERRGSASPAASPAAAKRFRPEIEGVRFLAALLVASFHTWTGRVSGGVDVFFVMSGFLITTTLLGHLAVHGRIRPGTYLSRLAMRLFPAAIVTLAAVLVATRVLLPTLRWEDVAREVRASALYVENWYLIGNSTDYLAQFAEKSPVQHFWALSLQGQFYLAWLVLFLVAAWMIRRSGADVVRAVGILLALVFVASLAASVWFTEVNQPVAYFATPTRAWEFALGGLAAVAIRRELADRSVLRWVLGWVGLVLVVGTGFVFQVSTAFPGYAALLPTGAALMILFSARSGIRFGADRLLSHPVLVRLGGLSYGLYLWHFPLLVFWRSETATESNGVLSGVALILVALVLAWVTQQLVERPVVALVDRSRTHGRGRRAARAPGSHGGAPGRRLGLAGLVVAPTAVALVATFAFMGQVDTAKAQNFQDLAEELSEKAYDNEPCVGAMVAVPHPDVACADPVSWVGPPPELIKATQELLPCAVEHRTTVLEVCLGGDTGPQPTRTVMFIGDSHALTMRAGIELVAEHHGWRLLFAAGRDCQIASEQKPTRKSKDCAAWLADLTSYVADRGDIDVLFTMQSAGRLLAGSPSGDPTAYITSKYREQWDRFAGSVGRIVVIRDNPRLFNSVVSCLAEHGIAGARGECARPRDVALTKDYAAIAATEDGDPLTHVADLTDVFCDAKICVPVIGGIIAYNDDAHLHTVFTRTLAPALDAAIRRSLDGPGEEFLFGPG